MPIAVLSLGSSKTLFGLGALSSHFGRALMGSPIHQVLITRIQSKLQSTLVMVNNKEFINDLTSLVKKKIVTMSRINDAVRRILHVKFVMGLFENPLADRSFADHLGKKEHRELARKVVMKLLVLLNNGKHPNQPLLPLPKKTPNIWVTGSHADNIGYQCGGWTIEWQGASGNITVRTTILAAIKSTVNPSTKIVHSKNPNSNFVKKDGFSYAIVVVGEVPYAETQGDNLNLTLPSPGPETMNTVCSHIKCVMVLVSGRPLVIKPYLSSMDALVAAWLPGSEGKGVTDVLFGDYGFTGKLPRTWFNSVDRLPMNVGDEHYDPLCPFGFGLITKKLRKNSK